MESVWRARHAQHGALEAEQFHHFPHRVLRRLRQAVSAQPANPELHDRLIVALVWLNRVPEAAEAAENKLTAVPARPEDFLRAASIHGKMVEWSRAASILERGLLAFPEASAIRAKLSEIETLLTPST